MSFETTGRVVRNGPGAQIYFDTKFVDSPAFPFRPGHDSYRAVCVPESDALLLVPADQDLDLPLTVRDPESYRIVVERTEQSTAMNNDTDEPDLRASNPGDEHS